MIYSPEAMAMSNEKYFFFVQSEAFVQRRQDGRSCHFFVIFHNNVYYTFVEQNTVVKASRFLVLQEAISKCFFLNTRIIKMCFLNKLVSNFKFNQHKFLDAAVYIIFSNDAINLDIVAVNRNLVCPF